MFQDEIDHLKYVIDSITEIIDMETDTIKQISETASEENQYFWNNIYQLDPIEIIHSNDSMSMLNIIAKDTHEKIRRLIRLKKTPYFGRISFKAYNSNSDYNDYYIGIYSCIAKSLDILVYDWRAPISSLYYDCELGLCEYIAPSGLIVGDLQLKRQLRIVNGVLEYVVDTSLLIRDEVLQLELSRTSDNRIRNIVATIQREQNEIIRCKYTDTLILQGVAGSGKTSIALHRIAFLLFKEKATITSSDILFLVPNRVFTDYAIDIIPELGEEQIRYTSFAEIVEHELDYFKIFEGYGHHIEMILDSQNIEYATRVSVKCSLDFLRRFNLFIERITNEYFMPKAIMLPGMYNISADHIKKRYCTYSSYPVAERIKKISSVICEDYEIKTNRKLGVALQTRIRKELSSMFLKYDIRAIYSDFINEERISNTSFTHEVDNDYIDAYAHLLLKYHITGISAIPITKHLIIDEMQDYNPLQYELLSKVFKCSWTILGDCMQKVNPYIPSINAIIDAYGFDTKYYYLTKSYRSSREIIEFSKKIINNGDIVAMDRAEVQPSIIQCLTENDHSLAILNLIDLFSSSRFSSMGIICKNDVQAKNLLYMINLARQKINYIDGDTVRFAAGVSVTTYYYAKGLEFDWVIVPFCNNEAYYNDIDRTALYIACTRALHRLDVVYCGNFTSFINKDLYE